MLRDSDELSIIDGVMLAKFWKFGSEVLNYYCYY